MDGGATGPSGGASGFRYIGDPFGFPSLPVFSPITSFSRSANGKSTTSFLPRPRYRALHPAGASPPAARR